MITLFDMASGEVETFMTEPELDAGPAVQPQATPQVGLRLLTVAEAVEMERRSQGRF